jgi:preprotein translocase subunit SecG
MIAVILVIHCMVCLSLIGVVLIQKSEGGGLGIGSGMSGFMTGRSQANLLTRTTSILAVAVVLTSIGLTMLSARSHEAPHSVLDTMPVPDGPQVPENNSEAPAPPAPAPADPAAPPVQK